MSIEAAAAMLICVFLWVSATAAWAEETSPTSTSETAQALADGQVTQTLSGSISETTIDSSVTTLILDGITVKDNANLTIEGSQVTMDHR